MATSHLCFPYGGLMSSIIQRPPKHPNPRPEDPQCDDSYQLAAPDDAAEIEDGLPLNFSVLYHVRPHWFGIHPEPSTGVLAAAGRP